MNNLEIGQRIKQRRLDMDLTQGDIANEIGVAISTIQRYETGAIDKIKLPVIEAIARVLRVSPDWLVGKSESPLPSNIIPMPETRRIPLIGTIACGEPILAEENLNGEVDLPEHIRADFALRCKGDSMINARIFDGDIVYIQLNREIHDGDIAAVRIGDEATLKRVYRYPSRLELRPENPTFPVLQYEGEQLADVQIIGKAVAFTSTVR